MQHCMKYDLTDQYFAWRYYIGECLQNGHLPLWNPYVHLGYPIHADPQSGAWYPFVWLIGGLFGYNIYWIQIEFLLHVFLAGVGMYLLAKYFVNETRIALAVALCYMLCGFFSGNAQHLTWVISGSWIPFVLYYFLRFQQRGNRKDLFRSTLSFFMLLTGGYPAFVITTAYALIVMMFVHLYNAWRAKEKFNLLIKEYFLFGVMLILTNAVSIASVITNLSASVRSNSQELNFVLSNPFGPKALLSWIFPLASVKNAELFNTDISMSNGYFGWLALAGLIFFLIKCRTKKDIILFLSGLFFLFLAFGDATPLRSWFYYLIPLFDRFRAPSLFRLFALILFIVCSAIGWINILKQQQNKKIVNIVFIVIALLISGGIIYASSNLAHDISVPNFFSWNEYINSLDFCESIFIQGIWQLIFLIIVMIVFNRSKNFTSLLPWFAAFDLCVATLVNNPITVVNDDKPVALHEKINQLPKNFPVPSLQPMQQFKDRENSIGQLWLNLGIWYKQPYWQGYNSYQSPLYYLFESSPQAKYVLENPLLYFSASGTAYRDTILDTLLIANNHTHLYISDGQAELISASNHFEKDSSAQFQISSFGPNQIKIKTHTAIDQWLTLLQQHVKGWQVKIDNHEVKSYTSNYLFISSIIPSGNHEITFSYQNKSVVVCLYITLLSLIFTLIMIYKKEERSTNRRSDAG